MRVLVILKIQVQMMKTVPPMILPRGFRIPRIQRKGKTMRQNMTLLRFLKALPIRKGKTMRQNMNFHRVD